MDFGHYTPNMPLPLGIRAEMDAGSLDVRLTESYVR
jgi:muramoyltetrapeptide carboxypeptidase LdcA involved in peptidoglycan recycling